MAWPSASRLEQVLEYNMQSVTAALLYAALHKIEQEGLDAAPSRR